MHLQTSMLGITCRKIPYFFSFDMLNYALMSLVYLSQMMQMKGYDPTWDFFESGKFSVNISYVSLQLLVLTVVLNRKTAHLKPSAVLKN